MSRVTLETYLNELARHIEMIAESFEGFNIDEIESIILYVTLKFCKEEYGIKEEVLCRLLTQMCGKEISIKKKQWGDYTCAIKLVAPEEATKYEKRC